MAGGGVEDNPNLKGLSRIFNAETNRGRGNVRYISYLIIEWIAIYKEKNLSFFSVQCAKATYAVMGLFIAYKMLMPSKKPAAAATK